MATIAQRALVTFRPALVRAACTPWWVNSSLTDTVVLGLPSTDTWAALGADSSVDSYLTVMVAPSRALSVQ